MKRAPLVFLILVVLGLAGWFAWWFTHRAAENNTLVLYGNVDLREVDLAFNNNERIAEVLVEEGDRVHAGELVARVDTSRLVPEEAQAAANVEADKVNLANNKLQKDRMATLFAESSGRAVSKQDFDNAKATMDAMAAREDADTATLALYRQELKDAQLYAPADAVVRSRLMEPGDMASPSKPVLTLALTSPKWVRVYVDEPQLPLLHPGMRARVSVDAFPDRAFAGWVGFISPEAEFTPKNIETTDLRTSLVYEVRVFVNDPADALRLGMPATVTIRLPRPASKVGT